MADYTNGTWWTDIEGETLLYPYEYWSQNAKNNLLDCFYLATQPIQPEYKYRVIIPDLDSIKKGGLLLGMLNPSIGLHDESRYLNVNYLGQVIGFDGKDNVSVGTLNGGDYVDITFTNSTIIFTLSKGQQFTGHYKNDWYINSLSSHIQVKVYVLSGIPPAVVVQKIPNI